ncbi:MAG: hypothetical protein CM15mP102_05550 [Flavobacteriales bacterium]|nr:MAG: hypothetical protein CM15mP102_05550 [Flavobacteriales bacterium]
MEFLWMLFIIKLKNFPENEEYEELWSIVKSCLDCKNNWKLPINWEFRNEDKHLHFQIIKLVANL